MVDWPTGHKLQPSKIMAILSKGNTYASGDSVTSTNLNALVDSATFVSGSNQTTDNSTLEVHSGGYLQVKDGGITNAKLAAGAVNASSIGASTITATQLASDSVSTAKIEDSAVSTAKIADDAITPAKISSTDTTFNVNDSNNNIGTGVLANASYQLTVDGGTGKDTIYAKATQASAYVDLDLENESATGNGARVLLNQGANKASLQYQESGEAAVVNILDGSLSATAGIRIACSSASQASVQPSGSMYSNPNSNIDLGSSINTWDNGYINGGAWTGSDRNLKQDIEDLSEAELKVATALKGLMKKFRLKDAVAKKGDEARIHIGVIAQDVKAAFEAEGLDAYRYAILGENTWWSKQNEEGEWIFKDEETDGFTKNTKMSVRYEQLLAFIITAL